MTIFDQRNQKVTYQYNAAGNINFGAVQSATDLIPLLQHLVTEVQKAAQSGAISQDVAIDAEAKIKKAIVQAQKPEAEKKLTLDFLAEAKALLENFTAAAGLVSAIVQAAQLAKKFFV